MLFSEFIKGKLPDNACGPFRFSVNGCSTIE